MPAHSIFSEAQREYVRRAYVLQGLQPSIIVHALNEHFGAKFTLVQVQRLINARWSKRRKQAIEKAKAINRETDAQLARKLTNKVVSNFAERAARGATKAFDMVDRATNARELSSAAAAAKSLGSFALVCMGVHGPGSAPGAVNFNFNFAAIQPAKVQAEQGAVEAEVSDVDDEADELAEHELDDGGAQTTPTEAQAPSATASDPA